MKKFLLPFLYAICAIALLNGTALTTVRSFAYAVSTPYAVIGEDVWLLAENGNKLFLLPRTYYAKIDRMDDGYYYVSFNGVSGKITKTSVSVVGYDKDVKETRTIIKIASEYSVFTEIKLRDSLDGEVKEVEATAPTSEPLTYLGTYEQGDKIWYYVTYGGEYGYVLNTYTDSPNLSFEPFSPVEEKSEEKIEEPTEKSKSKRSDLVKIIVISAVSAVAVILIIVLFLPRKGKKHHYYYS